jgi:predicted dinucleotide-utilizing enzyme
VATEVVELVAPPPSSGADNSGEEQAVIEAAASRAVTEPHVKAVFRGSDDVLVSTK